MKKILIAMDSFKGCLTSKEAGFAVSEGISEVYPEAEVYVFPVSDGGEGITKVITEARNGTYEELIVTGPIGNPVTAGYGIFINSDNSKCAVIEMAAAAGLTLVPEDKRNPLVTTTYGVGEMISDAYHKGCRSFIIGIGGSATNDAGIGMLSALGFRFLDKGGKEVSVGAEGIKEVCTVVEINTEAKKEQVTPNDLRKCKFTIACDVNNPLYGKNGCSMVFSLQKGASPEQARMMDVWMERFANLMKRYYPNADAKAEGAGAAGGLGYAFKTFLDAELKSGIDIVLKENGFVNELEDSFLVITGEGKLDDQTAMGKVPVGVARYAKRYGTKVIAFGGAVEETAKASLKAAGIDECYAITPPDMPLETAMKKEAAMNNLREKTAEALFTLLK